MKLAGHHTRDVHGDCRIVADGVCDRIDGAYESYPDQCLHGHVDLTDCRVHIHTVAVDEIAAAASAYGGK